jgi:hypothetical protein
VQREPAVRLLQLCVFSFYHNFARLKTFCEFTLGSLFAVLLLLHSLCADLVLPSLSFSDVKDCCCVCVPLQFIAHFSELRVDYFSLFAVAMTVSLSTGRAGYAEIGLESARPDALVAVSGKRKKKLFPGVLAYILIVFPFQSAMLIHSVIKNGSWRLDPSINLLLRADCRCYVPSFDNPDSPSVIYTPDGPVYDFRC